MTARIPRFDHREQYRLIRSEILAAIDQVLQSGQLILGPHVASFEQKITEFLGVPGFAVGVGNGTDAIAIALRALQIGAGHEVITVANTAVATISAIRMAGATPIFCEIDPDTLMMDPSDVEHRITSRTRAILPVHLYGNAVNLVAISEIARRHGLRIVEDCAQSLGTTLGGRQTGTWGDVGCFSFYPTKNLGAYGDGGLCFTQDPRLAMEIRRIRAYGCDSSGEAQRPGVNSRLDEMQAAILEVKLRHLPEGLRRRREIAALYQQHLSRIGCDLPLATPGALHSHHLFVVRSNHRDGLVAALAAAGIECGIHYRMPVHLMKAHRTEAFPAGSLPVTEAAATRVASLPCYPELTRQAVIEICEVVNEFGSHASHSEAEACGPTQGSIEC